MIKTIQFSYQSVDGQQYTVEADYIEDEILGTISVVSKDIYNDENNNVSETVEISDSCVIREIEIMEEMSPCDVFQSLTMKYFSEEGSELYKEN